MCARKALEMSLWKNRTSSGDLKDYFATTTLVVRKKNPACSAKQLEWAFS